mgnify:CR=1 FL=1
MNNELSLEIKTYADRVNKSLSDLKNQINNISNDVGKNQQKIKGFTDSVKSTFNVTAIVAAVKTASRAVFGFINDANDYSEALNLFNVVLDNTENKLSDVGKAGLKFQNTLAEAFGVQRTQAMTYQALYQSMAENMGIVEDKSYIMSENTTKLVNDLSSLYNKSEATTAEALRAGIYAGQTKPLRSFGLDVTERSLTPVLESLGIDDRTVRELNQAEKQILRYIAVLRQSAVAHGDWANTIESPSNQLKIFKNQLVETSVALGRLFQSAFANVLPYVNAFLMVVKEVAKAIANFFGLDLGDYNSSIASVDTSYEDLSDSIDGATEATKKLKRETLSFDQIHNIDDPDTSGGGGGVSGIGGVDQRLLDAIEGYDNGMDKVKMKATEIRDRIMEWLGFTKHVDAETGEVYFTYDGLGKTLSNMWKSFKNLNTQGKILVGLGLVVGATKLWNVSKKLLNTIGNSGLGKAVKSLITPSKDLIKWTKLGIQTNDKLVDGISEGIQAWRQQNGIINSTTGKLNGFTGVANGTTIAIKGMITGALGMVTIQESMKSISDEGANLLNVLGLIGGSFSTIMSGVQIGAIFGPMGAALGGLVGAITSVITAVDSAQASHDTLMGSLRISIEDLNEYVNSINEVRDATLEQMNTDLAVVEVNKSLRDELDTLVDSNGKIKEGYEDRVTFILSQLKQAYGVEFEVVDGVIQQYDEYKKTIDDVINKKKTEIMLNAYSSLYEEALKNETELWKKKQDALTKYNQVQQEYNEAQIKVTEYSEKLQYVLTNTPWDAASIGEYTAALKVGESTLESVNLKMQEAQTSLDSANQAYQQNIEDRMTYEQMMVASTQENYDKVMELSGQLTNQYTIDGQTYTLSMSEQLARAQEYANTQIETYKNMYGQISEAQIASANSQYETTVNSLISQSQTVESLTPEITEAWSTLANQNREKYLEAITKLPSDVSTSLIEVKDLTSGELSEELVNAFGTLANSNKVSFVTKISSMPEDTRNALLEKMKAAGFEIGDEFKKMLEQAGSAVDTTSPVENALANTSASASSGSLWSKIKNVANNIWAGITGNLSASAKSGTGLGTFANNMIESIKNKLGIHSPSRKIIDAKIGNYIFAGINVGMEDEIPTLNKTAISMVNSLKGTVNKEMAGLSLEMAKVPDISSDFQKITQFTNNDLSQVDYSLIERATYSGIARAIADYGFVDINVNSKVQEGVVTDIAINGINGIKRRTGTCPIEVL